MKKILVLIFMMILAVGLVACGDDETSGNTENNTGNDAGNNTENNAGDDATNDEVEEVELAQGVTDSTVTVGSIGAQSGPFAAIGTPYYGGMEAYFDMINEQGGVNGRTIELIKKDDEFAPDKAVAAMEELVYDEEVFAIVGQLGTPGVMATITTVQEEGIPSVYFGTGAKQLTEAGENFFPVQPNYYYEGKLMSKFAVEELGAENIVIIYRNDDVGKDGLEGFKEGLTALGKGSISEELAVNGTDTDFTVQIQKAKAANPDAVILYGLLAETSGLLKEIEKVDFNVDMITTYSNADASFLALASQGAPNVIKNLHVMGWVDATEEGMAPLVDAMAKYSPDAPVNAYTIAGWVAAETFVAGLKATGDNLSWEGFIEAMNGLTFTEGLAPDISYVDGKREGVTKMAMSKVVQDDSGAYIFEQETDFIEFE